MVTGIVYVVLEILQKNAMWVLGIFTGIACAVSFGVQHVWASMGLNLYYVGMSVVGLLQWKKASGQVGEGALHLRKLPKAVAFWSAALLVIGSVALIQLLRNSHLVAGAELFAAVAALDCGQHPVYRPVHSHRAVLDGCLVCHVYRIGHLRLFSLEATR